ncbi:baseplate wedge subunit [Escherichia phage EcS1]|uniref:Baseplate wedge protein gp7 n=1 Tax=Escherichia phage EcS1 TaxID=2083276 RepID=A0A2Z5ZCT7_9CAUD|nr:baseplate wedge subunit [Escherichia phage EcS1]BBC78222.1 Baseplate wedge initiator [Escherichia phage EcS1]
MTVKAPIVTSLRIDKLSANQVHIRWDDVGANFYYFVELTNTRDGLGVVIDPSRYQWRALGYTADNDWFEEAYIYPLSYYKMRVGVAAAGFEQSEWVTTEEFQTFETNAYTFETMRELTLVNKFIQEKFTKNNQDYINFNRDSIEASLMNESFQFSPSFDDLSSVKNFILNEDQYHEVQGPIVHVCNPDTDRVMLAEMDDVLYLFERFQPMVKVSNDKGQNWQYIQLFNDRVGNPVSRICHYQSKSTTYVLGYDRIFYGRRSNDIRWSADDVKFSSQDITFAKIGDQLKLGFDVEIFGTYSRLPGEVSRIAEAIVCNDDYVYVVARDKVRYAKLKNAPIDVDPASPTFGEKLFETEVLNITGNPKAVCFKMDSIGGRIFALITGEVKVEKQDPTNPENVIDSASKGVYVLEGSTWRRVFGNTDEERRRIEHQYTSMSTDGIELFFSSSNFKYLETVKDTALLLEYPELSDAIKYVPVEEFLHDKHYHMMSFRSGEDSNWETFKPGRMKYYAEPFFAWMKRSGNRNWITTDDHCMVVYADRLYTTVIDEYGSGSPDRIMHETWNKGECIVNSPNIEFRGFKKYAGGVLIHKNTGELIGYFEFDYRVRDEARIIWKPKEVMLKAYLQNQVREVPWTPEVNDAERDPDLRPLINKMMPDTYLLQDTNFEKFSEYYLQYISDGYGTHYNKLLNLIKEKYPREEHAWEYLWSEVYKRNIYLDKEKRDTVTRFFEARKADFFKTKGIEESYKFLFKVLYNEDVEIDIESKNTTEYGVIVESDNISEDLAGRTVYTPTGRCNVTYIERVYSEGKLQWRLTIHNLLGRFLVGQTIKSEKTNFTGTIVQGVRGKELLSNNIDYINRNRSYYVMKIKSNLPTSRYRNDVLRFVHPVGFGFIGITLLTMFINVGLTLKHSETIINMLKTYRWDAGLPNVWPDRIAVLDSNGNIEFDSVTGEAKYDNHPNSGQPFPLPTDYNSENDDSIFGGQTPDERRKELSPTMDQSAVTFSKFRNLVDKRLKDNIGHPRDPINPTQAKV